MSPRMPQCLVALLCLASAPSAPIHAASEVGMFGGGPDRNMADPATGLPDSWDVSTGENVKWRARLGSQSYGGPVLAGDRIYAGTNNEALRDPAQAGDRGNLMAFDAASGEFLWQSAHPKLSAGRVNDWPLQGVCSAPYVEGDRLWYVSNRAEILAVDTEGFHDDENDGPFVAETSTGAMDEDIVWKLDMIGELGVFPHNLAVGSPLVVDDLLFTSTGNGVDEGHVNIPRPDAPSFLAVDKTTGAVRWQSELPGSNILHGQWSNPTYGVAGGRPQVVFPGGDGWLYAFEPESGELLWKFDCNPKDSVWELGGLGTRNNIIGTPVFWNDRVYVGVGQDPEHGEAPGHLWVVDATGTGDVTGSGVVWHRGGDEFNRTISTAAIADGIVYIPDLSGFLYALDAETGEHYWTYDAFAAVWGSALVADGKVYLGDEDGDVAILRAGKAMELLEEINMGSAVYTTPIAEDGTLYIMTRDELWALEEGAATDPAAAP